MARRRRRRPTDWIVSHWSEGVTAMGADQLFFFDLLSAADLEAHQDRMTCIRIVGTLHFLLSGTATLSILPDNRKLMLRIFKGDERDPPAGPVPAAELIRYDPFLTANADDEYMWQREMFARGGVLYAGGDSLSGYEGPHVIGEDPYYSNIDCRVMRKLQNEERIILMVRQRMVSDAAGAIGVNASLFLRALVKLA